MSRKWKAAAIHWENHRKKGSAVLAWNTKNAGIVRDEGPIWADDVK